MILEESKALWVNMMLAWNMNNGTDGFIDFHANHHHGYKGTEESLRKMVEEDESISDHWIQEQYDRWFGKDRFMKMACYHSVDDENQFFNWLISKSLNPPTKLTIERKVANLKRKHQN